MMLNDDERRFLDEVVFSEENRRLDMERWIPRRQYAQLSWSSIMSGLW